MPSKSKIENIVTRVITRDEKIGKSAGGSGHLGFTSFNINVLGKPRRSKYNGENVFKVTYTYTLTVETEFTYYPDNPPTEYKFQKTILVDENERILKEYPKKTI